jgi:hypothetical protein
MRRFKQPRPISRGYLLFLLSACLGIFVQPAHAQRQSMAQRTTSSQQTAQRAAQRASSPQQILALGTYYYNNDDVSGLAEQSFRQLLTSKYAGTAEAESAQYFLASYYERKFYIQRAKWRRDDWNSLKQAAVEYRNYTDKYYGSGTAKWLSDSFFNLAVVDMQLNDNGNAFNELSKIKGAATRDPTIYIYQIIWSPQSKDVIDANLPAARLADLTLSLLANRKSYFDQRIASLTQWCQGQKAKPY